MSTRISDAASEPVSLSTVKQFLHVNHALDDAVITSLIPAARYRIQKLANYFIGAQVWRDTFKLKPNLQMNSPRPVKYSPGLPVTGATITKDGDPFTDFDLQLDTGKLSFNGTFTGDEVIQVDWAVGSDTNDHDIVYALLATIDHMYSNRGADDVNQLPSDVALILQPNRSFGV